MPNLGTKDRYLTERGEAEQLRIVPVRVKSGSVLETHEVDMAERGVLRLVLHFYHSFDSAAMPGHDRNGRGLVLRERNRRLAPHFQQQELAAHVRTEIDRWTRAGKVANFKMEQ